MHGMGCTNKTGHWEKSNSCNVFARISLISRNNKLHKCINADSVLLDLNSLTPLHNVARTRRPLPVAYFVGVM